MKHLWWKTLGKGERHLVLLHGWGLSAKVWNAISVQFASYFTVHLVDLPGFGNSIGFREMKLEEIADLVLKQAPDIAFWVGWSFGGLVASHIALTHPNRVQALITVASSPCFCSKNGWPGIKQETLSEFQYQLSKNFQYAAYRFLALQTMGTDTSYKDVQILKNTISSVELSGIAIFKSGLDILKTADLRSSLSKLRRPHFRIYGALDSLIPSKISSLLDKYWPSSESLVMKKAAHALFISHPDDFFRSVFNFINRIN